MMDEVCESGGGPNPPDDSSEIRNWEHHYIAWMKGPEGKRVLKQAVDERVRPLGADAETSQQFNLRFFTILLLPCIVQIYHIQSVITFRNERQPRVWVFCEFIITVEFS